MQDEEIIERIKKKDYAGLEELLAVYGDSMLRTIHSVLSQPHEVSERQDVANEVFTRFGKILLRTNQKEAA